MVITPFDELDAVNSIIGSIGSSPVNSLENSKNVDVINAQKKLNRASRKVQSKEWWFNVIPSLTLNPDTITKTIPWASDYLSIKGTDGTVYTKRGSVVFDFTNQTSTFNQSIEVAAILAIPFEDLPEAARRYITAKAARSFQIESLGDPALSEELARDEQAAWADLQEAEIAAVQPNMLNNYGVTQLLNR